MALNELLTEGIAMAFVLPHLQNILLEVNGPIEVGIAVNNDMGHDPASAFPRGVPIGDDFIAQFAIGVCIAKQITNPALQSTVVAAALLVKARGMVTNRCNSVVVNAQWVPNAIANPGNYAQVVAATDSKHVHVAMTMIFATKVNYWQTNHHTGQGTMSGFFAKVARAQFPNVPDAQLEAAGWVMGHWADTRQVLGKLGVPDIDETVVGEVDVKKDMQIRVASLPAGCAALAFCIGALGCLHSGIYSRFVPNLVGIDFVVRQYYDVLNNPVAYHVGHGFLAPTIPGRVVVLPPNFLEALSAFVHTTMPDSTLSKSRAIINADVSRTHQWSVMLGQIRTQLRELTNISAEKVKRIMADLEADAIEPAVLGKAAFDINSITQRNFEKIALRSSVNVPIPPVIPVANAQGIVAPQAGGIAGQVAQVPVAQGGIQQVVIGQAAVPLINAQGQPAPAGAVGLNGNGDWIDAQGAVLP